MRCKYCLKTFRSPPAEMKETQICRDCKSITQNNVDAKDINISKGQARILKSIARSISHKDLSEFSLRKALRDKPEIVHFINENWGNREHFIKLALDDEKLNPISLILYFLNLKWKIIEIPTKEKMVELSKINLSEYEKRFGTWENFLDLLGFDPWYRKGIEKQKEIQEPSRISKKQFFENETDYFKDDDSFEESLKKINELRKILEEYYKQKDSEENYSDYSYADMFQLLEKYLKLLPKESKYGNINNLI